MTGCAGADLGGGCRGCAPPPPEMTCGFLIQLVFCTKKKQETSAPPPKKNPGSAPAAHKRKSCTFTCDLPYNIASILFTHVRTLKLRNSGNQPLQQN